MVPLRVLQGDFCSFDYLSFDGLFESNFDLPAVSKSSIDSTDLVTFIDSDFFADELLKVSFFVKKFFDYYGIIIDNSVYDPFFQLGLEHLYLLLLTVAKEMDCPEKGYPACFLIIINVWFVADHFKSRIRIKLFFEG